MFTGGASGAALVTLIAESSVGWSRPPLPQPAVSVSARRRQTRQRRIGSLRKRGDVADQTGRPVAAYNTSHPAKGEPMIRPARLLPALTLAAVLPPGCKTRTDTPSAANTAPVPVPLYTDLGSHHHVITASPDAQQYFDQGLRLVYAFNHAEAIASFKEGARRDPNCAMCWWGVALALGPNINLPMEPKDEPEALDATKKAAVLSPKVTPAEQGYITA